MEPGPGSAAVLQRVIAREQAIALLRVGALGRGVSDLRVHRLPAGGGSPRSLRGRLGRQLRRGTIVEVGAPSGRRPIDRAAVSAGVELVGSPFVGAGGGVLHRARRSDGGRALLRVGCVGDGSDPAVPADALRRLGSCPEVQAPRLLDRGEDGWVSWTLETELQGSSVDRLTPALWASVVAAWRRLPRPKGLPQAAQRDLARIGDALPDVAAQLASVSETIDRAVEGMPAVLAHRDLWPGNLLVHHGELGGVVDWGAWQPDGLVGADLLQLSSWLARRRGMSLGEVWLAAPWRDPALQRSLQAYWKAFDVDPSPAYLGAVAVAWWASEIAGTLERIPWRREDESWLAANVTPVLAAVTGSASREARRTRHRLASQRSEG